MSFCDWQCTLTRGNLLGAGAEIGVASTKAYTSQIVAITMMALVLSEDQISKRMRRDEIIDSLCMLPDATKKVGCWVT